MYRSLALRLPRPAAPGSALRVRLEMAPLYWQIDHAGLARSEQARAQRIVPGSARDDAGRDRTTALLAMDEERIGLERGQAVDLSFPAEAIEGPSTVLVEISGYYEIQVGGRVHVVRFYRKAEAMPPAFWARSGTGVRLDVRTLQTAGASAP